MALFFFFSTILLKRGFKTALSKYKTLLWAGREDRLCYQCEIAFVSLWECTPEIYTRCRVPFNKEMDVILSTGCSRLIFLRLTFAINTLQGINIGVVSQQLQWLLARVVDHRPIQTLNSISLLVFTRCVSCQVSEAYEASRCSKPRRHIRILGQCFRIY